MQRAFPNKKILTVLMIALFSIFSPLGVAMGILIQNSNEVVEIIVSCLAGGSFLYISMSEIISEEFAKKENRCGKLFCYILGVLMITSLHLLH